MHRQRRFLRVSAPYISPAPRCGVECCTKPHQSLHVHVPLPRFRFDGGAAYLSISTPCTCSLLLDLDVNDVGCRMRRQSCLLPRWTPAAERCARAVHRTQVTPSLVLAICGAASFGLAPARLIPDMHFDLGALLARRPLLPSKLFGSLSRRLHASPGLTGQMLKDVPPPPMPSFMQLRFILCTELRRAGSVSVGCLARACCTQFELIVQPRSDHTSNDASICPCRLIPSQTDANTEYMTSDWPSYRARRPPVTLRLDLARATRFHGERAFLGGPRMPRISMRYVGAPAPVAIGTVACLRSRATAPTPRVRLIGLSLSPDRISFLGAYLPLQPYSPRQYRFCKFLLRAPLVVSIHPLSDPESSCDALNHGDSSLLSVVPRWDYRAVSVRATPRTIWKQDFPGEIRSWLFFPTGTQAFCTHFTSPPSAYVLPAFRPFNFLQSGQTS
ncbi:hypothetical protein B0H13DRAFT_2523065 [Mycena leptocephala]|nr:hypothetical protein B0H13DRAFT_2523065 [Mycena leptocephala]